MSVRETALAALESLLAAALTGVDVKRNSAVPETVGPGGFVILRDGSPGPPEVSLSPPSWYWEHRAVVEVITDGDSQSDRDELMDTILSDLGAAIATDPTLGGAVDHCEPESPEFGSLPAEAGAPLKTASVPVLLVYSTSSPLG